MERYYSEGLKTMGSGGRQPELWSGGQIPEPICALVSSSANQNVESDITQNGRVKELGLSPSIEPATELEKAIALKYLGTLEPD